MVCWVKIRSLVSSLPFAQTMERKREDGENPPSETPEDLPTGKRQKTQTDQSDESSNEGHAGHEESGEAGHESGGESSGQQPGKGLIRGMVSPYSASAVWWARPRAVCRTPLEVRPPTSATLDKPPFVNNAAASVAAL